MRARAAAPAICIYCLLPLLPDEEEELVSHDIHDYWPPPPPEEEPVPPPVSEKFSDIKVTILFKIIIPHSEQKAISI